MKIHFYSIHSIILHRH